MSFRNDFLWGAASAAYQIEGGWDADGKGPGIWDVLARKEDRVTHRETADISCDHYHRYKEDVAIMKELGIRAYRFSISWPRVLPDGTGRVNPAGLDFYSRLVDELLAAGIKPMVTLYHWDMPYALYLKGGWKNRDMVEWFGDYAALIGRTLGDRVDHWMTLNEPQAFVGLGYYLGCHAPFERCTGPELGRICHNVLLAHGKAVQALRTSVNGPCQIGMVPTGPCVTPTDLTQDAIETARQQSFQFETLDDIFGNSLWMDPVILGRYPEKAVELFGGEKSMGMQPEDMALISQPLDFYATNIYQSQTVPNPGSGYESSAYIGCPRTTVGWPVTPECLYWSPKFLYERYHLPILISENGIAAMDWPCLDGKIHDTMRIDFLHRYLRELRRAAEDGVDVIGYLYWSILDNYEWADGFDRRFGLVYVDYRDQARIPKDSAYWYRGVIKTNGENL